MKCNMVSVIVPVYNAERYICRCIDSILSQLYKDFELILVDDGSTDNSRELCESYLYDKRVRVYHQKNAGASGARNLGISHAKGAWIVFVDADDWCDKEYLQELMSSGDVDFTTVFMSIDVKDENVEHPLSYTRKEYYGQQGLSDFIDNCSKDLAAPVCRRFRKDLIQRHNLSFDEDVHIAEDLLFNLSYLKCANSIGVVPRSLYHYEKHEGSLTYRSICWEEANMIINRLGEVMASLPFKEKLTQNYLWGNILRKFLLSLQRDSSFGEMYKSLSEIALNNYVCEMLYSKIMNKSHFRKLFDSLMRNRMFLSAAILLKAEDILRRFNVIKWR